MTIIAVQKTTTGILMGADNRTSDGVRLLMRATPKIYQISPHIVMGSSGHVRISDIVRHRSITFPKPSDSSREFGVLLGEWFRNVLKDEPNDAKYWAIVAAHNEIYDIGPGGSVVQVAGNYHATGNAELVALGALWVANHALTQLPAPEEAKRIVTMALDACAAHVEAITPPWSFLEAAA